MKNPAVLFLFLVVPILAAQSPADPSAAQLKLTLAQKDLQIANLTKQLHQVQNQAGACHAAFGAIIAPQQEADEAAVAAATSAVKAATDGANKATSQRPISPSSGGAQPQGLRR